MIDPVAIRLAGQTEQKERTEFRERRVKGREQTQMWADWTWHQQRHTSRDKSVQAFSPLFVLQATKAGRGGLGTRLGKHRIAQRHRFCSRQCCDVLEDAIQCCHPATQYSVDRGGTMFPDNKFPKTMPTLA